jgi:MFS family permease
MGIATFLIAFVPGYDTIGIWGAIILTVLRMLQGIGVGGEWGGSVLIATEWSRGHGSRGLIASWPQFGVPSGLFLANLAILGFSTWAGADFMTWGWRAPFFLSFILVGVGLWIRLGILETPVFQQLLDDNKIEKAPILEVIKRQPREIILSALVRMSEQAPFYIFTAFVFAYGTGTLHMSRDLILTAVLVASCASFITIPLSGHISDLIGRRKMYLIGAASTGLFGFLYFGMLDTAAPAVVFIAIVLSLIPHDMQYGPQAALIAEAFTPRLRYSGASLGYQLASVIAGGPAPLIATALFAAYRLRDLDLYRRLRDDQPRLDEADAGLHRQGHFGGVRRRRLTRSPSDHSKPPFAGRPSTGNVDSFMSVKDYAHNTSHLFELGRVQGIRHLDMNVAFPFDIDGQARGTDIH